MFKLKYLVFIFISHSLCALTTLQVTQSTDNSPGTDGEPGDLRYCLNSMNEDLNNGSFDDYEIIFQSPMPMTIQLNGILPIINNSGYAVQITIGNSGSIPTVTIDGNDGAYSGFFIPMGNVTIQNMIFQNMAARGGNGGDGISGGGGGMGAGGAIYAPASFLNSSNPSVTLKNVAINNCSAVGGNGGNYTDNYGGGPSTGNEGGGGGGGFSGNGGSVVTPGSTGGAGGGGFGGDGGNVTVSSDNNGGGGGGGGGLGSRATTGITFANLGNGGSDQENGLDGNGYGLTVVAGSGAGGYTGGNLAGGGGGGGPIAAFGSFGGGGGGSYSGSNGAEPQGSIAPGGGVMPSGGMGADGGGGGGGGFVILSSPPNYISGQAGNGGYAGGGGGGAGLGASDTNYTVNGGSGGIGGGGGGGGVNLSGSTLAQGGDSLGGGGGGGGGPSNSDASAGGSDNGYLGGGSGGAGSSNNVGSGFGGGGGGGGSGLGGAIFVDSTLNFTIQALSSIPTVFNASNNEVTAGIGGSSGSGGGQDGTNGSALGSCIFLRQNSYLTLMAQEVNDLLTLGDGVAFVDDTSFGGNGSNVYVRGNGTVIYNGTSDYLGNISIYNANLKVNGLIDNASVNVCRSIDFSEQRGTLSGAGTLTGSVYVNSGIISPDTGQTLTLGSLTLNPADPNSNTLGSLVHIAIDSNGTSVVSITGPASLAGVLEFDLDPSVTAGPYVVLSSSGITGTFDFVRFTGATPNYTLSYLPADNPTYVEIYIFESPPVPQVSVPPVPTIPTNSNRCAPFKFSKKHKKNIFN